MLLRGSSRLVPSRSLAVRRASTTADPAKYNSFGSPKTNKAKDTRPLSPHVTIYRMPLPAVASITNRIVGVGMVAGAVAISIPALINPALVPAGIVAFKAAFPYLVPLVKLCVTFPLTYHIGGGLRHLMWDYGSRGIDTLQQTDLETRYFVWGTLVVALLLAFIEF